MQIEFDFEGSQKCCPIRDATERERCGERETVVKQIPDKAWPFKGS